ncbi:hypothetical protein [Candidatus Thiosymbion oneisti]|uniref:hypothetical protein n=1 Tax=Candidatus Thiosymbion oneisti TaxID=589554 RepID=UPI000B7E6C14|nr:hypothetical protein [Candidatus Thiosymbion oneisti]
MEMITLRRSDILAMIKEALSEYFRPVSYFIGFFDKTISLEERYKELKIQQVNMRIWSRVVQKAVCFNQGEYLQYAFLTAEKHKKLKDSFRETPEDGTRIGALASELVNYINSKFYEDAYENFKFIHAYFENRSCRKLRVCIKGNFNVDNHSKVISVFRDAHVSYDSDADVEKNYGFLTIYKNGTYFLENNIPEAAAEDRYFNPRLDNDLVKQFLSGASGAHAKKWEDCWTGDKEDKSSFYKSTLIIPMTLWNNDLSEEFKKLVNLENVDRTIFGFLCFDHVEADYFDEENDVALGYVFADILSMYIFARLIYMESSKTFNFIEDCLQGKGIEINPESLSSIWKNMPQTFDVEKYLEFKPKTTKNNSLFPMDEDLIRYVKSQVGWH